MNMGLHIVSVFLSCFLFLLGAESYVKIKGVLIKPIDDENHVTVTDGVDSVTWKLNEIDQVTRKETIDWPTGDYELTCRVTSSSSKNTSKKEETRQPKELVQQHKQLCLSHTRRKRALVAPGTNWCGPGNIAKDNYDLGVLSRVDTCCNHHDHCPLSIQGFGKKYGLWNRTPFTVSSCTCDSAFQSCLSKIGNVVSNVIGNIFFNLIPSRCIDFKYNHRGVITRASFRHNQRYRLTVNRNISKYIG